MVRRPIQQLSPSLVNRIAAGEVIERPANVVKELVENALDAGATQVTVEVEDGGRALIRVIDDGSGMPPDELPLAFAQHATSKIRDDEDLFRIATMGFRGEALASIGAVSHARILSRTAASEAAYEIHNRGGQLTDIQAAAGNVGTSIEVRNLFYNTPARRKFIKGSATEFGHISEMLLRIALPYPHVTFKLLHNGRTSMNLPAATVEERMLAAWPSEFHASKMILNARDAEIRLYGILGLPELARPTAKYQFLYLNGRYIRDRFVQHALREAYRGLTEPGRYPAAVLMLDIPPGDVDVNVHPTKIEVRFRDGSRIHGLVHGAVREKLLGSDLTPTAVPMRVDTEVPPAARDDLRQQLADFFRSPPSAQMTMPLPPKLAGATPAPTSPLTEDERTRNASAASFEFRHRANAISSGEQTVDAPQASGTVAPATPAAAPASALQLHNTYLVVQSDDGMLIIDQHALHERIMFEDLLARVTRGPLESQRLLLPQTIDVSTTQIELLEHIQSLLTRLGIEVSQFGPNTVAVQSFPSFLQRLDPGEFVRELLERGEQELLDLHEEELLHEILDMMSCKAAIKAGDPLSQAEIESLLSRRELVDRSSNCPHGRPTTLRLTLRDLEKQFKRTGF